MAKKMSRADRIEEKIQSGWTRVRAEIEVQREDAQARLDALEEKVRREEARLDAKILVLLKEDKAEVYDSLRSKAERAIDEDREARSRRSRSAAKAVEDDSDADDFGSGFFDGSAA